ncbi:MAG: hypothetical protein ACE5LU_29685, partial [Anaerolineae bacterium]
RTGADSQCASLLGSPRCGRRLLGISQRTLYRKIKAYGLIHILPDTMAGSERLFDSVANFFLSPTFPVPSNKLIYS